MLHLTSNTTGMPWVIDVPDFWWLKDNITTNYTEKIRRYASMKLYFHRLPVKAAGGNLGWFYFAINGWQPFRFLQHGGWVCLSLGWLKRYLWDVPKARGWRWD